LLKLVAVGTVTGAGGTVKDMIEAYPACEELAEYHANRAGRKNGSFSVASSVMFGLLESAIDEKCRKLYNRYQSLPDTNSGNLSPPNCFVGHHSAI